MEDKTPKQTGTNKRSQPSSSTTKRSYAAPMSAEEKLKKSMKGLSYTGSSGGLNLNTSSTTGSTSRPKTKASASRKKVGGVVLDLDTIEDATKQKFETKGGRKNVIILVLSLLLVVSLVYLIIAIVGYNQGKKEKNFRYFINGNASAEWIIEGKNQTDFFISKDLAPDTIYNIDSKIKTSTSDIVVIELEIKVLLNGESIIISGLQGKNDNLIRVENTNIFKGEVQGGVIHIFSGLDFSDAPATLKADNVRIEITATVNKK